MAINPGTRIGAYEVTSQLGEGGMGVVLRARDTKLLRDVALKVLPDDLANDPDRLSRLQREAQLLASVNHPNIAQIYGLEQVGGSGCIVMELVEGETLSDRLKNGPIPIDEAIEIAKQIADALAAAHERGIVHRDLKPANIKVTPNGTVKVLDFGLAKALSGRATDTMVSTLPTMVSGSVAGLVVGTPAYMSPEQARGKEVDARTDVWAFGCVLYQMLTAHLAFDGETATDMIAKIVTGDPDLSLLPPATPVAIRLLLEATLTKNVQQRLQHIGDMRLFLDKKYFPAAPAAAAAAAGQQVPAQKSKRGMILAVALQFVTLLGLIAAFLYFRSAPPPNSPLMNLEIPLPGVLRDISISPDGQRVAYLGQGADQSRGIWVRELGKESAQKLVDSANPGAGIVWSPDSRYIGYIAEGKLKKVDVLGGTPGVIAEIAGLLNRGGSWLRGNTILVTKDGVIARVSDGGGEVKPVTTVDTNKKEMFHAAPVGLPDGKHFLYIIVSSLPENAGIFVGSTDSKDSTRLMPLPSGINWLAYVPSGYILYSSGTVINAQRFNIKTLTIEGQPVPVADGAENGSFTVSESGLLMFRKVSAAAPGRQLTWFDRAGNQAGTVGAPANVGSVEISPAGDRVAVDMWVNNNQDIWAVDIGRGVPSRITFAPERDWSPSWSSDGKQLIFASARGGHNHIYEKAATGVGDDQLVMKSDNNEIPTFWTRNGGVVFSRQQTGKTIYDTWLYDASTQKESLILESPFSKYNARVSPDGRWIAYSTNDSGMYQIVVQSFPDTKAGKWQITAQGGVEPKWKRDGHELYYLAFDGKLMAVPLKVDPTFAAGTPVPLFETPLTVNRNQPSTDRRYDVAPDGRFLFSVPVGNTVVAPVIAIVNWESGVKSPH